MNEEIIQNIQDPVFQVQLFKEWKVLTGRMVGNWWGWTVAAKCISTVITLKGDQTTYLYILL
jgi:hypothetical protein